MALTEHGLPPDQVDESQIEDLGYQEVLPMQRGQRGVPPRSASGCLGSCKMPNSGPRSRCRSSLLEWNLLRRWPLKGRAGSISR